MNRLLLREQLIQFFNEDIGFGDRSAAALGRTEAEAAIMMKADGCFYGHDIIHTGASILGLSVSLCLEDGVNVEAGDTAVLLHGPASALLSGERVLLNLLQRLSGTATLTQQAAARLAGTGIRVTDTRKTTPGLRMLEKDAVRAGGGVSHRARLDDVCMIKENHIAAAGSITNAAEAIRRTAGPLTALEIEIETEAELLEAVQCGPDVIMLDNCTNEEAIRWARLVPETIRIERSGAITLDTIREAAVPGIDYISLGALTHSAPALDMSMRLTIKEAVR
ncbi:carboxylating nicotinate-nucleotide diphosphorylase [Alkalicoccus luteus]|uniref:carboxylating nicotinate-nucleotide diphosphorylase n=1 Tax=Alkalicoccus luteus TaxID=1237094 RepID=UPI0040333A0E